jgi:hypothetical protein
LPEPTPETTPVDEPTDATDGLLLLQAPPVVVLLSVVVAPVHTEPAPVIAPAEVAALTVTTFVAVALPQPLDTV